MLRLCLAIIATALTFGSAQSPTARADGPDLGYAKTVSWHVDGAPEVAAMEPTIHTVLERVHFAYPGVDGKPVDGFYPGPTYSPFLFYIRDTATDLAMVRYYYSAVALRRTLDEILRLQY